MAASNTQLTQQCVQMAQQIEALKADVAMLKANRGGEREEPFLDLKKMFPSQFLKEDGWREFADEFMDYLDEKDKSGAAVEALKEAATAEGEVGMPDDEDDARLMRSVFKLLKRVIKEPDAKMILRNIPDYNCLELWRQLMQRFDPQNETANMTLHNRILNPKPIKDLKEVNSRLARWEKCNEIM